MLILPRLLTKHLRTVEPLHAKMLSLDYATHAIQACRHVLTADQFDLSLAYLAAARGLFDGEGTVDALIDAGRALRGEGSQIAERVTWTAVLAVSVCWQREMQRERDLPGRLLQVDVLVVADHAQGVVGLCSEVASLGEWLEARWQLARLFETARVVDPRELFYRLDEVESPHAEALAQDYAAHALRAVALSPARLAACLSYVADSDPTPEFLAAREAAPKETWLALRAGDMVAGTSTMDLPALARQAQHLAGPHEARWQLIRLVETLPPAN